MSKQKTLLVIHLGLITLSCPACQPASVNKPITVSDGQVVQGDLSSVNGRITVRDYCRISGDCQTVNGRIDIGYQSAVRGIQSMNGNITVGERAEIHPDVSSVNGTVKTAAGTTVTGEISTVNGNVTFLSTIIKRKFKNVNGDILITGGSGV